MKEWLGNKLGKFDKDTVMKWGFLLGAGVLTLVSNIFDTKKKDRQFKEAVDKKVDAKIEKLLQEKTDQAA